MEFKVEDVTAFISSNELGSAGKSGKIFGGHIPKNNDFGLQDMDVIIEVSHICQGPQSEDQLKQFDSELKLCHLHHKNLIRLIGFARSPEQFNIVYELIQGKSLTNILTDLSWDNMLKILKGVAAGINYLHTQPTGPYVLGNLSLDNIIVTEDFTPKILNFKQCVVEGDTHVGGGTPGYYSVEKGGVASSRDEVLAFGILALQLITKDSRTAFAAKESSVVRVEHILKVYPPQYDNHVDISHPSYGQPPEAERVTQMVMGCIKAKERVDITSFLKDVSSVLYAKKSGLLFGQNV